MIQVPGPLIYMLKWLIILIACNNFSHHVWNHFFLLYSRLAWTDGRPACSLAKYAWYCLDGVNAEVAWPARY